MKRKQFISSTVLTLGSLALLGKSSYGFNKNGERRSKIPAYLKTGDTIGITSPAGYISKEDCKDAVTTLQSWGYKIKLGSSIGKKYFTLGGTDEERLADLQNMLDDDSLSAIMCARGGYGLIRIIDKLNLKKFSRKPKWIIGFSDVTILHSHINRNFSIATIHSKMCNSFPIATNAEPIQTETIDSIRKCLGGEKMSYTFGANSNNKTGKVSAELVGGNLKTLESLSGTASDIITANKILFTEDTGEYLYSIDRMFWNLKRTGKLSQLAGLIVGGFKIKPDDAGEEFGKTLQEIVLEKVSEYNYPVCFDFPVGHQKNNFAVKCGVMHQLNVTANSVTLNSLA